MSEPKITNKLIVRTWLPLAMSWILMGVESPAISAAVSRLPDAAINLAAYGGIVLPISFIIEAPVIMLLAASTALCKDWQTYKKIFNFMIITNSVLTFTHVLIAFTPAYDLLANGIIGVPKEIVEPGRLGLMIMTLWTWAIGYRRFHQGILIRFGHSKEVTNGTLIRLMTLVTILVAGTLVGSIPGIVVGAGAQVIAVITEAVYIGIKVNPVILEKLKTSHHNEYLSWKRFASFYTPLVFTSLLQFVWQPLGSAALSRMPNALDSLAVWPVITGIVFIMRCPGIAYNEVVIAMLGREKTSKKLNQFSGMLAGSTSVLYLLIAATPFALFWFHNLTGLPDSLAIIAQTGFWLGLPLPALSVYQSLFQGALLFGEKTMGVPESVVIFLLTVAVILFLGGFISEIIGLYIVLAAYTIGSATQTAWLWNRSRQIMRQLA